ncbi:hypothetical protein [Qipengyuania nanhaisediminis]|uniref:hypothetical protein n=1 Tax=Qipengyuania nanhaisediminis TaxID=604088 RepID=UPI0038B3D9B7
MTTGAQKEFVRQADAYACIWLQGKAVKVKVLWLTDSHAEICFDAPFPVEKGQSTALLVRDYLSLPMVAENVFGLNVLLRLKLPLHESVLRLVAAELSERGTQRYTWKARPKWSAAARGIAADHSENEGRAA